MVGTFDHYNVVGGQYDKRPIFVADLRKAWANRHSPHVDSHDRQIWINPTIQDLHVFYDKFILPMRGGPYPVAYDIETMKVDKKVEGESVFYRALTCIGFAPNDTVSIVVPFYRRGIGNYWLTIEEELEVLDWIALILEDDELKKLTHNGVYDMSWMANEFGIRTRGEIEDTMHMHHALEPELPKSLGVLGSIFTEEAAWKTLHKKATNKRDE